MPVYHMPLTHTFVKHFITSQLLFVDRMLNRFFLKAILYLGHDEVAVVYSVT